LARWQLPQTGGSLWRRSTLEGVGGWRTGQLCCQEHELYFRLLQAGSRFQYCDGCFAVYRDWGHGVRITQKLPHEVDRQRLIIMDRIESYLRERQELTTFRHQAINDMRHMIARGLWHLDRRWAAEIVQHIRESDPNYYPGRYLPSSWLYSITYRLLGFRGAQIIAFCKRALTSM